MINERSDVCRFVKAAIKAAKLGEVERCVDVLKHMKRLNLSVKDLCNSKGILTLGNLRDDENPRIRTEANVLFNSWMKTLYFSGRNPSSSSSSSSNISLSKTQALSKSKCTVVVRKSILKSKKQPPVRDSQIPKSNSKEMLDLFEEAKKYADLANAKGVLAGKTETATCVHNLSLLIRFPIISTATETRRIMERLQNLTKHKDRKICNSASSLLCHWRKKISEQQQ